MARLPMSKSILALTLPAILLLTGCGTSTPTYNLSVNVSFLTALDGYNTSLPQKNGNTFLCMASGQFYKADPTTSSPDYSSVMDESWAPIDLEIYSSTDNLIGVADSATPKLLNDGSCEIQFIYSKLSLPNDPIKFKTSRGSEWDIPQSQWKTGEVLLNGSGARF